MKEERPSTIKVWILASRPHTLTASITPVLVAHSITNQYYTTCSNCTIPQNYQDLNTISTLFALFACFIQLGTNLHNDYADFIKGADTKERLGQARATQKGWLTPFQTAAASTFFLVLAFWIGVVLTRRTGRWDLYMVFVTLSSVFNAVCYTGGPYPLGYIGLGRWSIAYAGLGDLFVFLYFGLVATVTVPYIILSDNTMLEIFNHELFLISLSVALPIGFLATGIIVVNNLRDRKTDELVGKNTLAVKFGETFSRIEYQILIYGSYIMLLPLSRIKALNRSGLDFNLAMCLPLLSFFVARDALSVMGFGVGRKDGADLNPYVGGTAKIQLVWCVLFVIGLKLS